MGKVIKNKIKGMSWWLKTGLVLALTLVVSVLLYHNKAKPVEAAPLSAKGVFAKRTSIGTQTITGLPFQPKAVIFFWTKQTADGYNAHRSSGYGFAAGSTIANAGSAVQEGDNSGATASDANAYQSNTSSIVMIPAALNPTGIVSAAAVTAFTADGFTLNWTAADAVADQVHYIALGGAELTNAQVGTTSLFALTGANAVTGVGFQPDAVMMLGSIRGQVINTFTADGRAGMTLGFMTPTSQGSTSWGGRGAQTAFAGGAYIDAVTAWRSWRSGADSVATYQSMDADGFTLNCTTAGGASNVAWLALKGGSYQVGAVTQRTSIGTSATTGLGFTPSALFLAGPNNTSANGTLDATQNRFSIGAASAAGAQGAIWGQNAGFNPNDANSSTVSTKVIRHATNSATTNAEADLQSFDADGFTLNWTTADATARRLIYFAIGGSSTAAPTLTTPTASTIGSTTATLGATVSADGGAALTARGTVWDTTTAPTANAVAEGGTAVSAFTHARSSLTAGTRIYYRGYATNSVGTSYSPEGSFYTEPATQASGVNFTSVGTTSMQVNWTGTGDGVIVLMKSGAAVDSPPVDGTYTGYTANAAFGSGTQIGTGNYVVYKGAASNVLVTGLSASTTYHVAVYSYSGAVDTAGDNQGTNYLTTTPPTGSQATNAPSVPTLASPTATAITTTTATLGANLTDNGGGTITSRGTVWGLSANPTTNLLAEGGTALGAFTQARTALNSGTKIYYRGYAVNGSGTGYSPDGSFYTEPTTQASAVNFTSVAGASMTVNWSRGNGSEVIVLAKSGAAVNSDPIDGTYSGYTANAAFGSGTQIGAGNYVVYKGTGTSFSMTGLTSGVTYHVAVYEVSGTVDTAGNDQGANYKLTPATGNQTTAVVLSATITTCTGCHGSTGSFTDGTARNNPEGSFPGSHNTHVVQYGNACVDCHVVPISTNSFNHRNQNVEMKNPINSNSGASYGRGTSWRQVNAVSPSTCSMTYCHSDGTSVASGTIRTNSSPLWGTIASGCTTCHNTGPNYANLKKNDTWATGAGWVNPANASNPNATYASYGSTGQQYLYARNYWYTSGEVAASNTITGFAVAVTGWGSSANAADRQLRIGLTKNGVAVNGSLTTLQLGTANGEVVVGAPGNMWGTSWTPAEIWSTMFGVGLSKGNATTTPIYIDNVKVIVFTDQSPKMNSHASHASKACITCHSNVISSDTTISNYSLHNNGAYNLMGTGASFTYNFANSGGTCSSVSCHGTANWGVSDFDCIGCHSVEQTIGSGPLAGSTRRPVALEFANTWSHKRSAGGAVNKYDCIVCHMEGDMATGSQNGTYHGDGYLQFRNPDTGTTIEQVSFVGWVSGGTSAGWYTSTGTALSTLARFTRNLTTNSLEQGVVAVQTNLCLKCHDADGALSTLARVGMASTKPGQPFMTSIAGAGYTGAGITAYGTSGNVTDIKANFATTQTSYHPVSGKNNNPYNKNARMQSPWNSIAKPAGTTTGWGYLISCFDCHGAPGATGIMTSTVVAHGAAATLRAPVWSAGTSATTNLCIVCHAGYVNGLDNHGTGSALTVGTNGTMTDYLNSKCWWCHSGNQVKQARPVPSLDVHGNSTLPWGTNTGSFVDRWLTNANPGTYAFIRNTNLFGTHQPKSIGNTVFTSADCMAGAKGACSRGNEPYTAGGNY